MIELSEILLVLIDQWAVILLFFLVAVLYSSVGFGGGSSYLAVLALTGLSFIQFCSCKWRNLYFREERAL